jgi:hypothetical protein
MAKKGTKKQAPNWVPLSFDEADLKKGQEGRLPASIGGGRLPRRRGCSYTAGGISGDVPRLSSL